MTNIPDWATIRYGDCRAEKNSTLIGYDTLQGLRKIHDATQEAAIWATALTLIERAGERLPQEVCRALAAR